MSEPSEQVGEVRMTPPHPGRFVREEVLEPLDLSIARAAEVLGVRRATLSSLVNEKAVLSPEMALRLDKAFGVSMDTLLRMQAWYDAERMRAQADTIAVAPYRDERSSEG
jgi:addiction module HigA family antidote